MRASPLDYRLRIEAAQLLYSLGESEKASRILRSCADYFTLAGFPLRALWAIKILEKNQVDAGILRRGYELLSSHYAQKEDRVWGDPIFEMSLKQSRAEAANEPQSLEALISEVARRAADIIRGANFPDRLPRFPLLSVLDSENFKKVARAIRFRQLPAGTRLIEEGTPGDAVHLIVNGRARVWKQCKEGGDLPLAYIDEGGIFGEMALVTESPRIASVIAEERLDLFEIPRSVLELLGSAAVTLQNALSRQVCDRMLRNLMQLSPVFKILPADRRGELMSRFKSCLFEADEEIITEGQLGRGLFIILDGLVQVSLRKGGRKHILSWLREGEIFGEISLLKNTPAVATCSTVRRTMLMFLDREEFRELFAEFPEVIDKMNELGNFRLLDNIYTLA